MRPNERILKTNFLTEPQSYKWSRLLHHSNAQTDIAPDPGYVEKVTGVFFRSAKNAVWINYYFSPDITSEYETNWKQHFFPFETPIAIREPIVLLTFSLVNAGHSQSQLVEYFNVISMDSRMSLCRLCISSIVKELLPHVYELLLLLFGNDRILVLNSYNTYFLADAYLIQSSTQINVKRALISVLDKGWYQELLISGNPHAAYTKDISCITNAVRDIQSSQPLQTEAYEKIFFVKSSEPFSSAYVGTPHRAIHISGDVKEYIIKSGFKILSFNDFRDLRHCISVLSQARQVITSWGNIAAANRFFYSTAAKIVLLGNTAYSNEYRSLAMNDFFGMLVFPVEKQFIIREFPDKPCVGDFEKVMSLLY